MAGDRTIRHDHEHWPAGHYRGRGNRQDETGPSGPFLEGEAAQHVVPPEAPPREEPSRDEGAEALLEERVREALRDHGDIDPSKIEVLVDGDHVVLRGSVRSHWAHHYASSLASSVDGIGSLENELAIERTESGLELGGPTSDGGGEELPKKHYP